MSKIFCQAGSACPANIGFETGNFTGWVGKTGNISTSGSITLPNTGFVPGRQTIFKADSIIQLDPYGQFPVTCPNGSNYSIKLGNNGTAREAESVSYSFTVPAGQNEFSIIYNFAVVFQNPTHLDYEQPKFSANVYDESSGASVTISCSSFDFVASGSLPGFQLSPVGSLVFYRPWSPVTIKLVGYQGKQLRLEFTTNDCTRGGHFGYAYLDVNENCASPISGNAYCQGDTVMQLTGPYGFSGYKWFNADFSQLLGTFNTLKMVPPPLPGTKIALEVTPYPGAGCLDTLYTTIKFSPNKLNFNLQPSLTACDGKNVNLTLPALTMGSDANVKFSYFSDIAATNYLPYPAAAKSGSTYYVKAENDFGCYDIKPIEVVAIPNPVVQVTNPLPVEAPCTVDITTAITPSSNVAHSFWYNQLATISIPQPNKLDTAGIFYIKAIDTKGCYSVAPVTVAIRPKASKPPIAGNNYCPEKNTITLKAPAGFSGHKWYNAAFTTLLGTADSLYAAPVFALNTKIALQITTTPGTNCYDTLYSTIGVYPKLNFNLRPSIDVCIDKTTDLTSPALTAGSIAGLVFSYFTDAAALNILPAPTVVKPANTYFIKAKDSVGCEETKAVNVVAIPNPVITVTDPLPVDYPEKIDITKAVPTVNNFIYSFWYDSLTNFKVPFPSRIDTSRVYYVKAVIPLGCASVAPINAIIKPPFELQVLVPNAFSPNKDGINDFFKFKIKGFITLNTLKVYTRSGQLVFETKDIFRYWDGNFEGRPLPIGTYYWIMDGTDTYWKKHLAQSGSITIIR